MTLRNFLGAFHISLLQSARLHHLGGKALLTEPVPSYLVVVAASEEALYHYLKQRSRPIPARTSSSIDAAAATRRPQSADGRWRRTICRSGGSRSSG
jgi:hypothetical protein